MRKNKDIKKKKEKKGKEKKRKKYIYCDTLAHTGQNKQPKQPNSLKAFRISWVFACSEDPLACIYLYILETYREVFCIFCKQNLRI